MIPEVFVLCDGANDSHGKLNILGAFDMIVAGEFPFIHPHCAVAARLRYERADSRESRIRLVLRSADGDSELTSIDTTLKLGISANPTSTANLIVNINSLRFDKPGDYSVMLLVDGVPGAITPLYVRSSQADSIH